VIWLNYHDEAERAQALVSIARGCQRLDSRLVFFSSAAICDATREAVLAIDDAPAAELSFRAIEFPADAAMAAIDGEAWSDSIEIIKKALFEISGLGEPIVAWVESPLQRQDNSRERDFCAYHEAFNAGVSGTVTIVNAFRLTAVPVRALFSILECSNALVSAKMILPFCPSWLLSPMGSMKSDPAEWETASADQSSEPGFPPTVQTGKLAELGHFGAGFVHELGNPLSIISSSLQYLYQRLVANNDSASDFAMAALHNVERMQGLLQDMLDFAGAKKPRFEQVDLNEAISEVLRFTSGEFAQRGIALQVSFDPLLPEAWADPFGVKQILLNLVKNALDAITEGDALRENGGGNTICLGTRVDAKGRAVIKVENNGATIPANVLPNLFRPFYTTRDGGTGLGLYLSRQIAKGHGGELSAKNLPAGGVRFTLTLPLDHRKGADRAPRPDR
jgi:signal transduction histidine kinase